ncbi:YtxH domain-containing protein [Halobacillus sp. A1]|uniref:YtxH domain-containing protein n=1 Tax=Halobacillus sp. A1 TaxID=2880262 RepID=UPI0020A6C7B6|nr:YtxH domain-containing protein [Halobacillus sp. A1]MCP3032201.1 YtxH domain-containing protein [Halobacillus sp. A1]
MPNEQLNQRSQQTESQKGKLSLAITVGALVGGILVLARNDNARTRLKETSATTKNSVSQYVSDVKADPSGAKNDLVDRIQKTASITKEALNKIQEILDTQGKDIAEKAQEVKDESQDIVSTAKDAGEELKEVGDKVKEAKDELTDSAEDEAAATTSPSTTSKDDDDDINDPTVAKGPVN